MIVQWSELPRCHIMFGWKTYIWMTYRMDDIRNRIHTYIHTLVCTCRYLVQFERPALKNRWRWWLSGTRARDTSLRTNRLWARPFFSLSLSLACIVPSASLSRHRSSNGGLYFSASFGFIDADAVPAHCGLGRGLCPRALAPARPLQGLLQSLCLAAPCIRLALFLLQVRPELVAAPEQRWRPFHPCAGQSPPPGFYSTL